MSLKFVINGLENYIILCKQLFQNPNKKSIYRTALILSLSKQKDQIQTGILVFDLFHTMQLLDHILF
jgi:hypothetical protein